MARRQVFKKELSINDMAVEIPFGKRLKSNRNETIYGEFPFSDKQITLPAGEPSPVVTSFIYYKGKQKPNFYQLKPAYGYDFNLYIEKTDRLKVVSKNAPDESPFYVDWYYLLKDNFTYVNEKVDDRLGYLKQGFNETIEDFTGRGSFLQTAVYAVAGVMILYIIILILQKFK